MEKQKKNSRAFDELGFVRFWSVYPKRVARKDAQKAWTQLQPDSTLVDIICAAVAKQIEWRLRMVHANTWVPEWPYPATWLRAERWTDELPQPKAAVATPPIRKPPCPQCADSGWLQGPDDPVPYRCPCRTAKARTA